jgi:excisionase family DNA binding protein
MVKNSLKLSYRPAQLAEAVGVSTRLIYREIKSGNLEALRLGRARLIRSVDAEKWLAKRARA